MLQVPLPLGMIFSPFAEKISQWLFLETLQESDRHYIEWCNHFDRWIQLNDEIEISIYSPNILSNEKTALVQLAIRTKENINVSELELLVEASNEVVTFQNTITARNLSRKWTVLSLPSIPLRTISFLENGNVFFPVRTISVTCISNKKTKERPVEINLSSTELLNDRFIKKWGYFWNMRAIDREYRRINNSLYYQLCGCKVLYGSGQKIHFKHLLRRLFKSTIGKALYLLLSRGFLIKVYFWLPIFLKRRKFSANNC